MDRKKIREMEEKLKRLHEQAGRGMDFLSREIRHEVPRDTEDALNVKEENEVLEEEDRIEEAQIIRIEEALQRIVDGIYGKCLDCGIDIKLERLEAVPYTKYCLKCQEEREKRHRKRSS